jgi:hypothetical protein
MARKIVLKIDVDFFTDLTSLIITKIDLKIAQFDQTNEKCQI